jgi:putative membrane-bound dehydrogenase-like protein
MRQRQSVGLLPQKYNEHMRRRQLWAGLWAGILLVTSLGTAAPPAEPFPPIRNTQDPREQPPTPEEELRRIQVPPGFQVTLFAAEPDVRQPIALCFDDRGRLWVAECYTYAGATWDERFHDRIVIFEDTDNDGRFDKRTVFWDQGQRLSGLAVGFGGVWVLCAPQLLFLPDRNGDDRPDGPPEVVLDGWACREVGHNIVNGLMWGPDGWLYGRHGIQETSFVGRPGTPPAQRTRLNAGIWRYHPIRKVFEVVAHGTTNPWGLDYDDYGQMFFTNNVIGHLWHLIPGAHYRRMYGEDLNPHVYGLIEQHADHYHWDTGKPWTASREGKGINDLLGGGHSHCGGMIYLGDNWPEKYRNTLFMCNTHGRRLNNDRLQRQGSGYVGRHAPDFLRVGTPWFRGTDLRYGPDGGVYVSDWTDLGECHDHDGVHRTSGRIFKITWGRPALPAIRDLSQLSDQELVQLQWHRNDWYVRTARRLLQERAAAGRDLRAAHSLLRQKYAQEPDPTRKLRALWALYVSGGTEENWLRQQLRDPCEHLRVWAIRLLGDAGPISAATRQEWVRLAQEDPSGLVRLFLASALQRLPVEQRAELAAALLAHAEDADDHNIPLMIWYGVEPLAQDVPDQAVRLARIIRIPLVRQYLARRLAEELEQHPESLNQLLMQARSLPSAAQRDILQGLAEALRGRRQVTPPPAWKELYALLSQQGPAELRPLVRDLAAVFGDGRALEELRRTALDAQADGAARRAALRSLLEAHPPDLAPLLKQLLADRATMGLAARGLAAFDDPDIPELILRHYYEMLPEDRPAALNTLTSRPAFARALLNAVAQGRLPRSDLSAFHARQIRNLRDPQLTEQLRRVWGEVRDTPAERRQLIAHYKALLTPERLRQADPVQGRRLFQQHCAACHRLFGQGNAIGPDLTGANRDNLDYLLENIVDPSAVVPEDFRLSIVTLKDGRVLSGLVREQTARTLSLQTQTDKLTLDREAIERIEPTRQSLMPDGLLSTLSEQQVCHLIRYLMSKEQVPLPKGME